MLRHSSATDNGKSVCELGREEDSASSSTLTNAHDASARHVTLTRARYGIRNGSSTKRPSLRTRRLVQLRVTSGSCVATMTGRAGVDGFQQQLEHK